MAKRDEKKTQQLATTGAPVPAFMKSRLEKDVGKGVSTAQEDNLVPLIYVLQAQSPQVNKRNAAYIEGAEASDIWLRNAPDPIVKGDIGILFQPCFFSKDWGEWVPRDSGGGFVARHLELPQDAKKIEDPKNPNRVKYVRPNGNEIVEARHHVGYVITNNGPLPYVISLSGSGHTVSRQWMFMMNGAQVDGQKAPSFAKLYKLTTKERSNASGTWFTLDVKDAGWVSSEADYQRGLELHDAFVKGEKKAEAPVASGDDGGDASDKL